MDNNLLVRSLGASKFTDTIVGPKRDEFHHIMSVDIIQGDNDYHTTGVLHVSPNQINLKKVKLETPNRPRDMGGVVITFWSEEHYVWSRQLLFHKGCIFESDTILEENVTMEEFEQEEKEDNKQLSLL